MQIKASSQLAEYEFNTEEEKQLEEFLRLPIVQAYINTALAQLTLGYVSKLTPGSDVSNEQLLTERQELHGAIKLRDILLRGL